MTEPEPGRPPPVTYALALALYCLGGALAWLPYRLADWLLIRALDADAASRGETDQR